MNMEVKEQILVILNELIPGSVIETSDFRDDFTIKIRRENIIEVCELCKSHESLQFKLLEDLTAVDWGRTKNRFSVVYQLFSLISNFRVRLMADVDDKDNSIETVTKVWRSANWAEREVYDMFGITFLNHPDLRRMYMPEEFEYYPLRKEYPLMGIPGALTLPKK